MSAGAGATVRSRKRDRSAPLNRERNTGTNRRKSILEEPKSAPPNQAGADAAGISPQELAVGEKVPLDGLAGGPPQVGPACEAAPPLR